MIRHDQEKIRARIEKTVRSRWGAGNGRVFANPYGWFVEHLPTGSVYAVLMGSRGATLVLISGPGRSSKRTRTRRRR